MSKPGATPGLVGLRNVLIIFSLCFSGLSILALLVFLPAVQGSRQAGMALAFILCYIALVLIGIGLVMVHVILPLYRLRRLVAELDSGDAKAREVVEIAGKGSALVPEVIRLMDASQIAREKVASESLLNRQFDLIALQSQINPHFLYNTLDSIRGQVIGKGLFETGEMVESLSLLFRYSINRGDRLISFERELENIDNYMKIMRYRFEERFRLIKHIPEDSAILGQEMPKLTLQPVVENAIIHGLEPKRSKGTIIVRATSTTSRMIISVEDDGVGMDIETLNSLNARLSEGEDFSSARLSTDSGIALTNVNQRIRLIYGDNFGMHVNSIKGLGTEVHITLPLRKRIER